MKSVKAFRKTRAYSRIFIDNIGNQGYIPEIIYYKLEFKKKKKGKEKNRFPLFQYSNTSKTYTNRSFVGTVNACDPIISNGLSESILKKQVTNVVI